MTSPRRILVITSCTGVKAKITTGTALAAERLYAGEQHRRLMRGVNAFRGSQAAVRGQLELDLWIVSAGYGLVRGDEPLSSYDTTFSGMRKAELIAHAEHLQVPSAVSRLLSTRYAMALILLGDDYLRAAALDRRLRLGGPAIAFCGKSAALRLQSIVAVRPIVLGTRDARRFACGLIGLKGELARRALLRVAHSPESIEDLANPHRNVLDMLDAQHPVPIGAAA